MKFNFKNLNKIIILLLFLFLASVLCFFMMQQNNMMNQSNNSVRNQFMNPSMQMGYMSSNMGMNNQSKIILIAKQKQISKNV